MLGKELDKQIYKEGEPTWGCKHGVLDVEDVKKFLIKRWSGLFNILNDLNISVYKKPLSKETAEFVDFFRKALSEEIDNFKAEAGEKLLGGSK